MSESQMFPSIKGMGAKLGEGMWANQPTSFDVQPNDVVQWTKFSQQDKTWAEFSTLDVAVCMPSGYTTLKQNCLT